MRMKAALAAAFALLALSGCERFGIGAGANTQASANASGGKDATPAAGNQMASNATPAPPPSDGGKDPASGGAIQASSNDGGAVMLNRAYLVGRWTDDGDCATAVDFENDGSFTASNGARGIWNLQDDRLTVRGSQMLSFRIAAVDQNTMNVINDDGSIGRSTRC